MDRKELDHGLCQWETFVCSRVDWLLTCLRVLRQHTGGSAMFITVKLKTLVLQCSVQLVAVPMRVFCVIASEPAFTFTVSSTQLSLGDGPATGEHRNFNTVRISTV